MIVAVFETEAVKFLFIAVGSGVFAYCLCSGLAKLLKPFLKEKD